MVHMPERIAATLNALNEAKEFQASCRRDSILSVFSNWHIHYHVPAEVKSLLCLRCMVMQVASAYLEKLARLVNWDLKVILCISDDDVMKPSSVHGYKAAPLLHRDSKLGYHVP